VSDVLIVAGVVAGSSLALMLGRKGQAVHVFEKARFPREKPCEEGLMPEGVAVGAAISDGETARALGYNPAHGKALRPVPAAMTCEPKGHCWCVELPHGSMPTKSGGCLCRECLTKELRLSSDKKRRSFLETPSRNSSCS
jgi:hypothetical protein